MAIVVPIRLDLVAGYRQALGDVALERRYIRTLEAPPLEKCVAFVSNNIARGNPHFVALASETVVGWCDIVRPEHPWETHSGTLGMGVLSNFRGQGIGLRLMTAALDAARAAKLHRVALQVLATNTTAIALYAKVGFTHEGRRRDAMLTDAGYCDLLTMGLLLVP